MAWHSTCGKVQWDKALKKAFHKTAIAGVDEVPCDRLAPMKRHSLACGGFQNLGALFGSPSDEDHNVLESILAPPLFWETPMFVQGRWPEAQPSALNVTLAAPYPRRGADSKRGP